MKWKINARNALSVCERTKGRYHDGTQACLTHLILIYTFLELYVQAIDMADEVFQRQEQALGQDHICTLAIVDLLGGLLSATSKHEQAEEMICQALTTSERDHKGVFITPELLATLSKISNNAGKYQEAESTMRRALTGMEDIRGKGPESTYVKHTPLELFDLRRLTCKGLRHNLLPILKQSFSHKLTIRYTNLFPSLYPESQNITKYRYPKPLSCPDFFIPTIFGVQVLVRRD